ncbi:MAG: hypothetical protein V1834_00725 [Candidatus Micrarchaeota archaeon]
MAEIKQVIKNMLDKGMSREEVIDNLRELGFENAEQIFDKNAPVQAKPVLKESRPVGLFGGSKEESSGEDESEGTDLFGGVDEEEKEKAPELPQEEEELLPDEEEAPKLDEDAGPLMTSIDVDGSEKQVDIRKRQTVKTAADEGAALMTQMPETRLSDTDSVEAKLDETIALLKALQEINKRIVDSERKILLRLEK